MQSSESRATPTASLMDLLLRSGEALRNWRALATLICTGVATIVIFMALAATGNGFVALVGAFLSYVIASVGISATGILLMDQALNMVPRSMSAALMDGVFAAMRLFVIALIGFAVALVTILVVALLVAICKIPGLGGFLYAIVLPASVLTFAFVFSGLYFVMALAGAAVWSGASIRQAVSALYLVVSRRLVESALGIILLTLIMILVGSIIAAFVSAGFITVAGLSLNILGTNIGMPSMDMLSGRGYVDGVMYGGMFGGGILFALISAVLVSMGILGLNRLYLHLTANLDLAGAEVALANRMKAAKERARAMQEETRRRTEEMRQRAQQTQAPLAPAGIAPAGAPAHPVAAAPTCPQCADFIAVDDVFCGGCGHKLA